MFTENGMAKVNILDELLLYAQKYVKHNFRWNHFVMQIVARSRVIHPSY